MAHSQTFILGISTGNLLKSTQRLLGKISVDADYSDRIISKETGLQTIPVVKFLNSKNVPRAVFEGSIDAGITGWDRVTESGLDLVKIAEFNFSKTSNKPATVVMFKKKGSRLNNSMKKIRVITEYPKITKEAMAEIYPGYHIQFARTDNERASKPVSSKKRIIEIHPSEGGTEQMVLDGHGDAGFCISETGESLKNNDLIIVKKVLSSPVVLISREETDEIKYFAEALGGSLRAEEFLLIKANAQEEILKEVTNSLPAVGSPTISLLEKGGYAVEAEIPKRMFLDLYIKLRKIGATGIVSIDLNTSG